MKITSLSALLALLLLAAASCSTPTNITYLQDLQEGQIIKAEKQLQIKVKPEDKLAILVTTQDPTLSTLFNLVQSQSRLTQAGTNVGANSYSDGRTNYYTVSPEGDITFPVIGKIHIAGLTRSEVAQCIEDRLVKEDLVKQPVVTVEFIGTGVSVLGEVARPGRYDFNQDQMTLLDALSFAGDLKNTGERENVRVLRKTDEGHQVYIVDLTDSKTLSQSPVYYLQQDDIIYVEPNIKAKRETTSAGNTPYSPSFWVSIGSIGISLATLVVTISK